MAKNKKKLSKTGKVFVDVLMAAALGVACFSGYQLYKGLQDYKKGEEVYDSLKPIKTVKKTTTTTTESASVSAEEEEEVVYDFDSLKAINPDVLGWIAIPGTRVDYPFVQGTDNEYYLKHLVNYEYNNAGTIFMDVNDNADFTSKNTVLYGHHMRNGTMFADIENYKNAGYYESHKYIEIFTPEKSFVAYPIAGYLTTGDAGYVRYNFADDDDFMNYVNDFVSKSTFQSEQTVNPEDRILMLSTCSYDLNDGRYVLIAKLVEQTAEQ